MAEVLVTGGTGLVGGRVVRHLTAEGIVTRVLVRDTVQARKVLPEGTEPCRGDLTDPASLRSAVDGIRTVFHCAGVSERWLRNPDDFGRVNTTGTLNLLQVARQVGVGQVVHLSSSDTLQGHPGETYDERARISDRHELTAHGLSKLAAEHFCLQANQAGLPVSIVHASHVFGLEDTPRWGLNRLIADFAAGNRVHIPAGSLPTVFADDVAAALILAADCPPGTRLIATDQRISLRGLANALEAILERPVPTKMLSPMAAVAMAEVGETAAALTGRPPKLPRGQLTALTAQRAPDSRSLHELGWKPTPFVEALRRTLMGFDLL